MEANIRELKAKLSGVIRRVRAGETVTVSVRNRPVARIVPIGAATGLKELMRTPGIAWKGGKPAGLPRGERLPRGVRVSDWVSEDRR
jgi:prevent-host-death family protein